MKEEEKWKALSRTGKMTVQNDHLLRTNIDVEAALAIGGALVLLAPALFSVSLLRPHFFEASCLVDVKWRAPHVTALERLMMNRLFARGLQDVSLSSCLFND